MKRLFCVKDSKGRTYTVDSHKSYHEDKVIAKRVRDGLNERGGDYHVSRGPDHMGKHGHKKIGQMRLQPRRERGYA